MLRLKSSIFIKYTQASRESRNWNGHSKRSINWCNLLFDLIELMRWKLNTTKLHSSTQSDSNAQKYTWIANISRAFSPLTKFISEFNYDSVYDWRDKFTMISKNTFVLSHKLYEISLRYEAVFLCCCCCFVSFVSITRVYLSILLSIACTRSISFMKLLLWNTHSGAHFSMPLFRIVLLYGTEWDLNKTKLRFIVQFLHFTSILDLFYFSHSIFIASQPTSACNVYFYTQYTQISICIPRVNIQNSLYRS